jgi:hypothetical protein
MFFIYIVQQSEGCWVLCSGEAIAVSDTVAFSIGHAPLDCHLYHP